MADSVVKYEVRSFDPSRKDKDPYVVECHEGGKKWTCSCPHWMFRLSKSGTRCKHIDKVIDDNRRNEEAQRAAMKRYEAGLGSDWDDQPVKPDEDDDVPVDKPGQKLSS